MVCGTWPMVVGVWEGDVWLGGLCPVPCTVGVACTQNSNVLLPASATLNNCVAGNSLNAVGGW